MNLFVFISFETFVALVDLINVHSVNNLDETMKSMHKNNRIFI
jgi:hypothetical protein